MKNSPIGKITTAKSGFPRSKFNLSHDVNTTCGWTDIQPIMCRTMLPDSSASVILLFVASRVFLISFIALFIIY